ncbi:Mitochondrial import receptor subunit TOM7-like protein [Armadillidium nasatum]|uniref:Mitochondrial import receptor subunit TOM7 homolog n=1 Tax=Armadillidium nasatum TaxID=96803 RepID=A0A5N5TL43_9CRUS|nr:Mitochondrial import receptor subunit TOM7-like protein [Armadillidium nasatum]
MVKMPKTVDKGMKQRVKTVLQIGRTVFQYGYIPAMLYLGFTRGADKGMPPISFSSLFW